jgi:hypothetical protein
MSKCVVTPRSLKNLSTPNLSYCTSACHVITILFCNIFSKEVTTGSSYYFPSRERRRRRRNTETANTMSSSEENNNALGYPKLSCSNPVPSDIEVSQQIVKEVGLLSIAEVGYQ